MVPPRRLALGMNHPELPDHLHFLDMLGRHIAATPAGHTLGLALIHIPCVSRVDALMGFRKGDDIAQTATRHLKQALKENDYVYRVDRATLACVLTGLANEGQGWSGAFRILRILGRQVEVGEHFIQAMPAVGLAFSPGHGTDPDMLLQRASLALQSAPHVRDRIAVFDAKQDAAGQHDLSLQSKLKRAVEENGLVLHFQPKMDLRSGAIISSEALSRWDHPELGRVPPSIFIRAAETAGWMPGLTRWLLHSCLRQWQGMDDAVSVGVNLSAQDLVERDLPELVSQALATWDMPASRLILEVTETAAMESDAALEDNLRALRQIGVHLSIDDFGTGYSSLARLKILPVDEIKIDVSFVRDMAHSAQDERIVRSVIDLAHNLGISVVAEGVENRETLDQLAAMGCDIAQGYIISPPLNAEEFAAFLARHRAGDWIQSA
jgi:predicted signal transduction protein with EAL and GGDEF domain